MDSWEAFSALTNLKIVTPVEFDPVDLPFFTVNCRQGGDGGDVAIRAFGQPFAVQCKC